MIVKSILRRWFKEHGYRMEKSLDSALEAKIIQVLGTAAEKAKADNRKTIRGEDIC